MKLATRYILIISALLVVIAVSALWYGNYSRRQQALREAKNKALIIINHNLAIHTYFSHQLKPKVFEVTDKVVPRGYFEPAWMSSTYAVRGIEDYFRDLSDADYYYKECAINARTTLNEAYDYEADFLKETNADPKLKMFSGVKTIDGKKFYVVMRRGEVMEQSCLRCHSTPQAAPAGMIEKYGTQRSFNRYEGEVVSAISIRIPLDEAYAQADQITYKLALLISVFVVVVVGVIVLLTRRMFGEPLQAIKDQAAMIAQNEENLGDQLPLRFPGEWNDLARDFNTMSATLRDTYDNLDFLVQKRTEELEQALAEVKQLSGMLPICSHCKKIRDDQGYWKQLEEFISKHSDAQFSHGICPECLKLHYPEVHFAKLAEDAKKNKKNKD
jgi:hypothetical protein